MSAETKLQVVNESPKEYQRTRKPLNMNDVEMVFGTPTSPKIERPDVHLITNERKHGTEPYNNNHNKQGHESDAESGQPTQPLLEPDREPQKPPLAGPEIDDLDDEKPSDATPYPGIDDGLLDNGDKKPEEHNGEGHEDGENEKGSHHSTHEDGINTEGKWDWPGQHDTDEPDYPFDEANGLTPRFGLDDRPGSPMMPGTVIPDVNTYQQKKNLAQGMMDLALLSANANQLRYVLESSNNHPYFYPSLIFITLSIIFQIAVGVGLILNSRYNVKDEKDICKADKINNMTVLGIFLITIVNVFITSFSVATPTGPVAVAPAAAVQGAG